MATDSLVGNWNIHVTLQSQGNVSINYTTGQIEALPDGSLSFKTATGATYSMKPAEASGFSLATGSLKSGGMTGNSIILVASEDGKLLYGATKSGGGYPAQAWWGVRAQ